MEKRAAQLGMPETLYYMFPENGGLNSSDMKRAVAARLPIGHILADIHTGGDGGMTQAEGLFAASADFKQGAVNAETNAGTHHMKRAVLEAADLNNFLNTKEPRMILRTASFCTERSGHFDSFDQGLSFFLPNMTWLQPPGYVHQMYSDSWLPHALDVVVSGRVPQPLAWAILYLSPVNACCIAYVPLAAEDKEVSKAGGDIVVRYVNKAAIEVNATVGTSPDYAIFRSWE
eukprot:gene1553-2185_t